MLRGLRFPGVDSVGHNTIEILLYMRYQYINFVNEENTDSKTDFFCLQVDRNLHCLHFSYVNSAIYILTLSS